jgi:hypothetical protein
VRKEKEMKEMIYIIGYLVVGLLFGLEAVNRFIKVTGFNRKTIGLIGLGLIVWMFGWAIFVSIRVYKKELA